MTTHTWRDATRTQAERAETASALARAERAERERDEALTLARERLLRIEELDRAAVKQREIHDSEHARSVVLVGSLSNDAYTMSAERDAALARAEQAERERDEARAETEDAVRIATAQADATREARAEVQSLREQLSEMSGRLAYIQRATGYVVVVSDTTETVVVPIGTTRSGCVVHTVAGDHTCPGRAACDCPAGEMCEGTVAP